VVQQTGLTGRAIQWVGPPQRSWVVSSYWDEILPLPPDQRRLPREDERPVLATGTWGVVGDLVRVGEGGHFYALSFPVGDQVYELETDLPQFGPHRLVRLLELDQPAVSSPPSPRRYADLPATSSWMRLVGFISRVLRARGHRAA
jgi:hypothetical protein